jgi:hypothetical protein
MKRWTTHKDTERGQRERGRGVKTETEKKGGGMRGKCGAATSGPPVGD